jgi:uncharacterized protein YpmB
MVEIFLIAITIYLIGTAIHHYKTTERAIYTWAESEGYKLVKKKKKKYDVGPFEYQSQSTVYSLEIQDKENKAHKAWVQSGNRFWPLSKQIQFKVDH